MQLNIDQDSEMPVVENELIEFLNLGQMAISVAHGPPSVSHPVKTDNSVK